MHRLLHMRIHRDQPLPQIRKLINKHLRIKRHSNEERSNTTLNRNQEDISNLQTNQECKCHNDSRESAAGIVVWFGELEV